jgi:hypothetical protein
MQALIANTDYWNSLRIHIANASKRLESDLSRFVCGQHPFSRDIVPD